MSSIQHFEENWWIAHLQDLINFTFCYGNVKVPSNYKLRSYIILTFCNKMMKCSLITVTFCRKMVKCKLTIFQQFNILQKIDELHTYRISAIKHFTQNWWITHLLRMINLTFCRKLMNYPLMTSDQCNTLQQNDELLIYLISTIYQFAEK